MSQDFHDSRERGPFPKTDLASSQTPADTGSRSDYASALRAELVAVVQRRDNARRILDAVRKTKKAVRQQLTDNDLPETTDTHVDSRSEDRISRPPEVIASRRCVPDSAPNDIVASTRVSLT